MPRITRDTRALLRAVERSERRSSLFWWMVENHDEFARASSNTRIDWAGFCAEAARRGLTDTLGKPPTERNARETWSQARKSVAQTRERQAAEAAKPRRVGAIPPSRLPKDWKPEAFRQPAVPTGALAVAQRSSVQPSGTSLVAPPVPSATSADDPMSKESRAAMVLPGMPAWTAPTGRYVEDEDPPEVKAKLLRAEAQHRALDQHFGPPIPRREE